MKARLLISSLFIYCTLWAQKPLSASLKTSTFTYVYGLKPQEAILLYKSGVTKVSEQYLHTIIDSFPSGSIIPQLKEGNYLLFHAAGSKQRYELITSGDVQLKVLNNRQDLAIILHTNDGSSIPYAKVSIRGRKLAYHPLT